MASAAMAWLFRLNFTQLVYLREIFVNKFVFTNLFFYLNHRWPAVVGLLVGKSAVCLCVWVFSLCSFSCSFILIFISLRNFFSGFNRQIRCKQRTTLKVNFFFQFQGLLFQRYLALRDLASAIKNQNVSADLSRVTQLTCKNYLHFMHEFIPSPQLKQRIPRCRYS